jgi:exodeoxyribonuclease V alpha subunit
LVGPSLLATRSCRSRTTTKDVYNGDVGYIEDVDPDAGELTASFDGRAVTCGFGELDTLVPAYAATIHKS